MRLKAWHVTFRKGWLVSNPRTQYRLPYAGPTSFTHSYTSWRDPDAVILPEPTWSVRSLLPSMDDAGTRPRISSKQLHHLLRLSALAPPGSPAEEAKMLQTLTSQLHFVKDIRNVDTTGVEPLRCLRDETLAASYEDEISVESLRHALYQEEHVGEHHKRIRRMELPVDTKGAEDWDPLDYPEKKVNRYYIVDSQKD